MCSSTRCGRNGHSEDHLDDLRQEILRFDNICGLQKYNGGQWSHVALHE
jgi:hypothetical protein